MIPSARVKAFISSTLGWRTALPCIVWENSAWLRRKSTWSMKRSWASSKCGTFAPSCKSGNLSSFMNCTCLRSCSVNVKILFCNLFASALLFLRLLACRCKYIFWRFGIKSSELPQPELEWKAFSAAIAALNEKEPLVWSPISKNLEKWINIKKLNDTYGSSSKSNSKSKSGGTDIGDACCIVA